MTNAELLAEIVRQTSLPHDDVKLIQTALVDIISERLTNGDEVAISKLGTFRTVIREARPGRNPRTGNVIQIRARISPTFRPAGALREVVDGPQPPDQVGGERRRRA